MNDLGKRIANLTPEKRALLERHIINKGKASLLTKPGIRRRGTSDPCVLSFAQQRLWFLDQLEPGSPAYNMPLAIRLSGRLNVTALQQGIGEILRRHEVLRTTFYTENDQPVQRVTPATAFNMEQADLSAMPEGQREGKAKQLASEEASLPFDLTAGPLLRATLVRLAPEDYVLLLTMHHIISDGWSMGILYRELSVLYEAFSKGKPSPLPELPIQYADFAVWQREWLQGKKLEEQLTFWKEQLRNITTLQLPTDHPRPSVQTFHGATHTVQLPQDLTEALQGLSRKEGVTLFMTLLTAFQGLLHRYTGQDDIVVGTPIANRNRAEIEGLIGFFVNTLVMRTDTSGNPVFRELLKQVRKSALDAYAHQDLPFEKLIMELQPGRDMSRNPIFQVMFALQNVPPSTPELSGLTLGRMGIENTRTKFDLEVALSETMEGVRCTFVYNTDLFEPATIERMAGHYQKILEGIVTNPDQRLSKLPLLTEAERHQLLVEWNNTGVDYPRDKCIHELFEKQVERTPDATAVVFEDQMLTYRELNSRANQLASYLRKHGVGPEVLVGICVERSLEMVIAILGILKAGGAYVPLDPAYPEERLTFMLDDMQASVLITQTGLREKFPAKSIRSIFIDDDREFIYQGSPENLSGGANPDNLAYIIYTSGSTGRPKGVLVTHYNVVRLFESTRQWFHFNDEDVWTLFHSYAFDFSVWELWGGLLNGGRLVVVPFWVSRSLDRFHDLLIRQKVTVLNITPSAFRQLIQEERDASGSEGEMALRLIIFGGEKLHMSTLKPWYERHEDRHPQLVNMYGITETTVHVTYQPLTASDVQEAASIIGRPIPDLQVYILDQNLQPVPIGVPGEIYVGGDGLARGYLNRPQLTAERFMPNPFSENNEVRLYKTGDLARYLPDGNIEFLGRIDDQIKIRGFRIEPGEIESALVQHPAVRETAVIAQEDQRGEKRLAAYIVFNQRETILTSELRSFLKEKIPDYMVPSAFVALDALPLTPNGKINHRALPEPEIERPDFKNAFVGPRTPIEELLASIWCEVLGLKEVGIHDNFFELGGHSLLATQVISRLRNAFQVQIPLRRLFETPTISGLAEALNKSLGAEEQRSAPLIVPMSREKDLPLSFSQQRLWFLDQLEPGSSAYNIPHVIRLSGRLNVTALEQSIGEILRRHEVLRTTFSTENDQPVQKITPATTFSLPETDLSAMPEEQREAKAKQLASEEASRPFDLVKGPLLRAALLRLKPEDHVLLLTMHHIISDGWSMGILYRELSALYEAFSRGDPSPLPELPIQYADFAVWQREWLQGKKLEEQLTFWKEQLRDITTLQLPTDHPRPSVQTFHGAVHTVQLPMDLTEALQGLSRKEGVTLFMTLLTAFQGLLHRYTGQDDIVVGTPIANRNRAEIEGLIGFFVNTLVMRTDTSGNPVFRELLKRVRKSTLDAYAHQDLPFEKLIMELKPERDLSRNPVFQVMFALQNVPVSTPALSGLTLSRMGIETARTKFDLEVALSETMEGLQCTFVYNTDLFEPATIKRMAGHYQKMLEGIVTNPDQRLSELPLLTEAERHKLLVEWNNTGSDYPRDKCIHELFEEQVDKTLDAIAVVFEDQQLTYRELNSRANQLAHYLKRLCVGPEVLVGICVERSMEMVIGILGILKAGGAYVPLDPDYPKERLAFMIEDTAVPVLLTQAHLAAMMPKTSTKIVFLDADKDVFALGDKRNPDIAVKPENLAYVIYTSGSTGNPKGVMISHMSLCNHMVWMQGTFPLIPSDKVLQKTLFTFDASVWEFFAPLLSGAGLIVAAPEDHRDSARLIETINKQQVTVLQVVPSLLNILIEDNAIEKCKSLRRVFCGGEVLPVRLCERFFMISNAGLINLYGPTESCIDATFRIVSGKQTHDTISIGRPISNTQLYILDKHLQPVPIGVQGELCLSGDGLARGYLNHPELTAQKFIPNPFSEEPGAHLYKTGDLVRYLPDGNVEYSGRIDNQVKLRGFRIELGEIESVLAQHQSVREAVVVTREAIPGDRQLVAYVVPAESASLSVSSLKDLLSHKLPSYMIPSFFVLLGALPLTPNGKIDRKALPAPDRTGLISKEDFVSPEMPTEKIIAGIWAEVLGLDQVGIHDNFFELGGHSLLATQVISRLRNVFEIEIPLRTLFEFPTVGELAFALLQKGEREKVEQRAALLLKVAELSEDEVNTMIAEQIHERHNKTNE